MERNGELRQQIDLCFSALQQLAQNLSSSPGSAASSVSSTADSLVNSSATTSVPSSSTIVNLSGSVNPSGPSIPSSSTAASARTTDLSTRSPVWEEHSRLFRNPTRHVRLPPPSATLPYRRRPVGRVWRHNFLCLASRHCVQVPNHQRKDELRAGGLGEKQVQIGLRANASQFREKLFLVFPKLRDGGGYDLLRCLHNSRSLVLLRVPSGGHTPETLRQAVGQARIYIRPLQRDLQLSSEECTQAPSSSEVLPSGVFEKCLICNNEIPIEYLSQHLTSCTRSIADDDNDFTSEPPWRRQSSSSVPAVSIISSPGVICINTTASSNTTNTVMSNEPGLADPRSSAYSFPSSLSSSTHFPTPSPSPVFSAASAGPGTLCAPGPSSAVSDDIELISDEELNPQKSSSMGILREVFPDLSFQQCSFLEELFKYDVHAIISCLVEGPSMEALLKQFQASRLCDPPERHITLRLDHFVEDGIRSLFKGDFKAGSNLVIDLKGKSTPDLGGPRKQFLTKFLQEMPATLKLVEPNEGLLFPTCNTDNLLGGHYRRLGELIVSSVLQEGPGFHYFPKAIYSYFVGGIERAITHLSVDELPVSTQYIVKKILDTKSESELEDIRPSDEYLAVTGGMFTLLQMSTRDVIVQQIMLNEVICTRKAALDDLLDGLCVLRFNELFQNFPDTFEPLFVASAAKKEEICPDTLLKMIKAECSSEDEETTFQYLNTYIGSLDSQGCKKFLYFVTGAKEIPPMGFSHPPNHGVIFAGCNKGYNLLQFITVTPSF